MHSCFQFHNCFVRPKTRDNISLNSEPTEVHVRPAMNGFFQKAVISKNKSKLVDIHAKRSSIISFRCSAVATTNNQEEPENYQVFLSFRGETRARFTCHLYKALTQAGYRTFIDYLMRRGINIEEELTKTIRNSQLAVTVISPGYASSQSCLDELVEILLCRRCFGLKVLPVFYLVDPDDVYNLTGDFGATFDCLVERLEDSADKTMNHLKKALKEVASISGLVLRQHQNETYFIDQIVTEVKKLLGKAPQRVPSFVIGWYSFIHGFKSYIIIGIVDPSKYLFVFAFMGLMVIRLGIAVILYLHSVKQTEKLMKDNDLLQW